MIFYSAEPGNDLIPKDSIENKVGLKLHCSYCNILMYLNFIIV